MEKYNAHDLFLDILKPFFKERGFKYVRKLGAPSFIKKDENMAIEGGYNIQVMGKRILFSKFEITYRSVEEILWDVDLPNFSTLESYKEWNKYFMGTVVDKQSRIEFDMMSLLENEQHVVALTDAIKNYFDNQAVSFIQKYSYLPNVLEEMDRLEKEGKDWNEILGGMGDRLFRALIISKLCNDPNYESKECFCDQKFQNVELLKSWQPNYAKLKGIVHNMKPLYNI